MIIYINKDADSEKSLRQCYLTHEQKPMPPLFYGDKVTLEIDLLDFEEAQWEDSSQVELKLAIGNFESGDIYKSTTTIQWDGQTHKTQIDIGAFEFDEFIAGYASDTAKLEIQMDSIGETFFTKTILQTDVTIYNSFLFGYEWSFVAPNQPSNLSALVVPLPSVPSNLVVDTIPQAPSNIDAQSFGERAPVQPSDVEAELFVETEVPSNPSLVEAKSNANAPTQFVATTLAEWIVGNETRYVPSAYRFEATGRFTGLNDKIFAWDGTTLENGAPVYNCTGPSCATGSNGVERIYANNVYSDTIEWRVYYLAEGGAFDGSLTTVGLASNLFPINFYNLSYYETSVSAEVLKFIPTLAEVPSAPSQVSVDIKPLLPSLVNAVEVYYNYDPDFETQYWDGLDKQVILLLPMTLSGSMSREYPIGSILETIGVADDGYPVRVQDPNRPRDYPYTVENQNTGAWTWLNENDRGTFWEFITTEPFPDDPIRRYHERIELEVSQLSAVDGIALNGKYEEVGHGYIDTDYFWKTTGYGGNTPYIYRKRIEANCTEPQHDAVFLYKRIEEISDFLVWKWEWSTAYPPTQGITSLTTLATRDAEFGGGLSADDPDAWSQSWGTQVTDSGCPLKPLRPTNVIVGSEPSPPSNVVAEEPAIELYILAGQSNAHGHAPINVLTEEQATQEGVFYTSWHNNTSNASTTQYYSSWANQVIAGFTKGESGESDLSSGSLQFGPEVGFVNQANAIGLNATGRIGILKHAIGASTLADDPNDPSGGLSDWDITATGDRRGDALRAWKSAITDGLTKADSAFNYRLAGMIWWQGESGSDVAGLQALIAHMRNWLDTNNHLDIPKEEFPVVITKIGYGTDLSPVAFADDYIGIVDSAEYGHSANNNHVGSLDDGDTDQTGNGISDMFDIGQAFANEMARAKAGQAKVRWQPEDLNLRYWMDANASANIIESNGIVTTIGERTGNGPTLTTATGSTIEHLDDIQNGQSVLRFGASDHTNTISGVNFTANAHHRWYLVLKPVNIDNQLDAWLTIQGTQQYILMGLSGTQFLGKMYNNGGGSFLQCSNVDEKGEFNIFQYEFDIPNHQQSSLLNGNPYTTDQSNTHLIFSSSTLRLNKYIQEAEGDWGEIIFAEDITDAESQKIEGYLAHKWGLTDKLPSSHPYKTLAPIADETPNAPSNLAVGFEATAPSNPSAVSATELTPSTSFNVNQQENNPFGLAWDGTNFWVSGMQKASKFNIYGNYTGDQFTHYTGSVNTTDHGMTWNSSKNCLVFVSRVATQSTNNVILKELNTSGSTFSGAQTFNVGAIAHPRGVVFDGTNYWIAGNFGGTSSNPRICKYSSTGTLLQTIALDTAISLPSGLVYIPSSTSITNNASGSLLVVSHGARSIARIALSDEQVYGVATGLPFSPTGLVFDGTNYFYARRDAFSTNDQVNQIAITL